jgi:hypothetical protein
LVAPRLDCEGQPVNKPNNSKRTADLEYGTCIGPTIRLQAMGTV